jgi:HprK-related kinase A
LDVAQLSSAELRHRLNQSGLRIRVGPVVAAVRSPFSAIESSVALHYAAHEVVAADAFTDFELTIERSGGIRRWVRPRAAFRFDSATPFKPLPGKQAFALLEWGFNWAIAAHCHQYLNIHSAVVERDGRAMLLPAPPGSGKSTLCAALVARGWRLLSDELTIIDLDAGCVVPVPRPISLKNASIDLIRAFWPEAEVGEIIHDTLKGSVAHVQPPAMNVHRSQERAIPGWIVLPRYQAGESATLSRLSKPAAFMQLIDNAFNYSLHGRHGFDGLSRFVDASDCYEFRYGGALDEAVRAFDHLAQSS